MSNTASLVWLKWRLLVNGIRNDRTRAIGFPIIVLGVTWLGVFLNRTFVSSAQSLDPALIGEYSVLVAAIGTILWATIPVMIFPVDETLDPAKFSTLPFSRRQLIVGLAAAGLVTPPILAPAIALGANFVLFGSGPSIVITLMGYLLLLISVAVVGQSFTTGFSIIVKSRRGRDLVMLGVVAIGVALYSAQAFVAEKIGEIGLAGTIIEYGPGNLILALPPAAAQAAVVAGSDGRYLTSAGLMALTVGELVILGYAWHWMLDRLTTNPEQTQTKSVTRMKPMTAVRGWSTTSVVFRKELRLYVRDPRMRMVWTGGVIFLGILGAGVILDSPQLNLIRDSDWAVLTAPGVVLFVGLPIALNQFGWERRAASFLFALPAKPRDILLGKNAATALILTLEATLMTLAIAWLSDGWHLLWISPAVLLTAALIQLAIGNLASVLAPLRLPDMGTDVFSQASEHGFLAILSQLISFFLIGLCMVPVATAFTLSIGYLEGLYLGWVIFFSVLWGALLYGIGLWAASRLLQRRLPEVLKWVSIV